MPTPTSRSLESWIIVVGLFLAGLFHGTASNAQATCTYVPSYGELREYNSVDQFLADYPVGDFEWSVPILYLEGFFQGNCRDEEFLSAVANGIAERLLETPLSDKSIFNNIVPGAPGDAFSQGIGLYFLGREELITRVLSRYVELRDDGNPVAATVLATLGGAGSLLDTFDGSLDDLVSDFTDMAKREAPSVYNSSLFGMNDIDVESSDSFFVATRWALRREVDANLGLAMDAGYAPAFAAYVAKSPFLLRFCQGDFDQENGQRSRLLSVGAERFASAAARFALDTIKSTNQAASLRSVVQSMNLTAANALTNCRFDYAFPPLGQSVVEDERADDLVHLAAHAVAVATPVRETLLALAYLIQEDATDAGAHYAAARLFVNALALELNPDALEFWISRMKRETVVEAQEILAEYDLYTGAIDGIAGSGFRAAIGGIQTSCLYDPSTYPNLCNPEGGDVMKADWLEPYIKPLEEIEASFRQ